MDIPLKSRIATHWSGHSWLIASLTAAVAAGVLLAVAETWSLREQGGLEGAKRDAARHLVAALTAPRRAMASARQTLEPVGGFPDFAGNTARCQAFFDNRRQRDELFFDLGLVRGDGVACGALAPQAQDAWAAMLPAQRIPLAVRPFPGEPGAVAFLVPLDAGGSAWAYAGVSAARLLGPMPAGAPAETLRLLVDASGIVLAADEPAPPAAAPALIDSLRTAPPEGSAHARESAEVRRAYHYRKLNDEPGRELYLALGVAARRPLRAAALSR